MKKKQEIGTKANKNNLVLDSCIIQAQRHLELKQNILNIKNMQFKREPNS